MCMSRWEWRSLRWASKLRSQWCQTTPTFEATNADVPNRNCKSTVTRKETHKKNVVSNLPQRFSFNADFVVAIAEERWRTFLDYMLSAHACFEILAKALHEEDEVFGVANVSRNRLWQDEIQNLVNQPRCNQLDIYLHNGSPSKTSSGKTETKHRHG